MFFFVALHCLFCALAVQPFRRCRPSHGALWVSLLTRLRAASLSVAASAPPAQLQAMSANVGLFMPTIRHLPSWHPAARRSAVVGYRAPHAPPLPGCLLAPRRKWFKCGGMWGFPRQCPSSLPSISVPSPSLQRKTFSMSSNVIIFSPNRPPLL
jgi:hypothetical protein